MAWFVFFALVIALPVGLLVWRRHDTVAAEDTTPYAADPHANRDYAADGGPTPHHGGPGAGTDSCGGGGNISGTT